ncbi:hypothetical protein CEXT_480941 [Caerostris extrusa]|uniref:Uncharacterized protein n=1 Tax=Caerostris extrusa TaxID=172846 RepID=A0AAV4RCB3_CAEEX|nr:hypothetical protein CEXT_480941 [Caerostris extrusa]
MSSLIKQTFSVLLRSFKNNSLPFTSLGVDCNRNLTTRGFCNCLWNPLPGVEVKVLVEAPLRNGMGRHLFCGCVRNMETDSLLMLSVDSLRGYGSSGKSPAKTVLPHKQPFCSNSILLTSLSLPAILGVGCNRNLTTLVILQLSSGAPSPPGRSEVRLMVNGTAVPLPSLTQAAMRIDVCLSWCKDLARLKSACWKPVEEWHGKTSLLDVCRIWKPIVY